jgi:hypothetical protein
MTTTIPSHDPASVGAPGGVTDFQIKKRIQALDEMLTVRVLAVDL